MLGVGVKDVGHVTMNEKLGRELKMAEGTMRRSKFEALIEWCWIGKSRLCCTYHFILGVVHGKHRLLFPCYISIVFSSSPESNKH